MIVINEVLKLVNVSYNKSNIAVAIKQASTTFYSGIVYAITGCSGSGKRTLLSLIAGFDTVSEGSISFNQTDIKDIDKDLYRKKNLGIIKQYNNLLPYMSAVENTMLCLELADLKNPDKRAIALDLLNKTGLNNSIVDKRVSKLNSNDKLKIALANILAQNPQLIIVEEFTNYITTNTADVVFTTLQQLAHEDNKTVIIITESKELADKCDEIYGMKNGVLLPIRVC